MRGWMFGERWETICVSTHWRRRRITGARFAIGRQYERTVGLTVMRARCLGLQDSTLFLPDHEEKPALVLTVAMMRMESETPKAEALRAVDVR